MKTSALKTRLVVCKLNLEYVDLGSEGRKVRKELNENL